MGFDTVYLLPLGMGFGALIGYLANRLAIWLLFNPVRPVRIWRFRLQGVIPKKSEEIVERIAFLTAERVINAEDITKAVSEALEEEITKKVSGILEGIIPSSIKEIAAYKIVEIISPLLRRELEGIGDRLDVEKMIREKLREIIDTVIDEAVNKIKSIMREHLTPTDIPKSIKELTE